MQHNPKFGPREQTREQRQTALDQALAMSRGQGIEPEARAHQLYARYVAGELTMREVVAELSAQDQAARVVAGALASA